MSRLEFTVNGTKYSAGKLSAKKQFHLSRRLAPLIGAMASVFLSSQGSGKSILKQLAEGKKEGSELSSREIAKALVVFGESMSKLPDETFDCILGECLSVVQVKQSKGTGWADLVTGDGELMYENLDMVHMLAICFHVLRHNLGGFTDALPSNLMQKAQELLANG